MRWNYSNINPNDQRLFPFVGGLVLGGVTGAAFSNNRFNQPYYYYPMYYPPVYYPNYNYQLATANQPQVNIYNPYITDKIVYEESTPLIFENSTTNQRSIQKANDYLSLKDVPVMSNYRSDML